MSFIDELNIKILEQVGGNNFITIGFEIDENIYGMGIQRKVDKFYPELVVHFAKQKKCPLCGENSTTCSILMGYIDDLFNRLITSQELRLNWLYIPH